MTRRTVALVLVAVIGLGGVLVGVVSLGGEEDPGSAVAPAALVRDRLDAGATVLDVRTPEEYAEGHVAGARPADLSTDAFDRVVAGLPREASYVVYCASGRRAAVAVDRMREAGFDDVVNGGGLDRMAGLGARTTEP